MTGSPSADKPHGNTPEGPFLRWVLARPQATTTLVLILATGILEGVSLTLLVPLLALVGVPVGGADAFSAWVAQGFAAAGVPVHLATVLGAFVLLQALAALGMWAYQRSAARVQYGAVAAWRRDVAAAVETAPWQTHSGLRPARIAQALTTDPERVGLAVLMVLRNIAGVVLLAAYLLLAVRVDWFTTLVVATLGGFLLLALRPWTTRSARHGHELVAAMQEVHHATHHWLTGMKLIKLHGGHARIVGHATDRVAASQTTAVRQQATAQALFRVAAAALMAGTVAIAVTRASPAALLFLIFLFARTLPRLGEMQRNHQQFRHALPAHHHLQDLVTELRQHPEPAAPEHTFHLDLGLTIEDAVVDHGREQVGPVRLHIPAGATHILRGPSGSGKTTTLDLAAGILTPTTGQVRIGAEPLDPRTRVAWRRHVGYLPQEPFLVDGTVRDNLQWAAPGSTETGMWSALQTAHCDFVQQHGLDFPVGDQGRLLSGGQRRRLALAMALARRPLLLVLDEPFAGLDTEAADKVRQALDGLQDITILMAQHEEPSHAA